MCNWRTFVCLFCNVPLLEFDGPSHCLMRSAAESSRKLMRVPANSTANRLPKDGGCRISTSSRYVKSCRRSRRHRGVSKL